VALAAAAGVGVLAVTDHDTLDGVPEALEAGAALGVRVIPGVEVSVRAPSGSLHLLAYLPDVAAEPIGSRLAELRAARVDRAARIVGRLVAMGVPVAFADVAARAGGPIGRPHVADALVAAGHARDRQDAFDRFLADGAPAYVPHETLGPRDAIRLVTDSGGAPVLAHPASLRMEDRDLERFVMELRGWGLVGIEVHRPDHAPERRRGLAELAARLGLVPCGGSDFHRPHEGLTPGDTGDPPLPADVAERLLPVGPEGPSASVTA
jgi:predicted metal-dependent phosphoesterase TrpH